MYENLTFGDLETATRTTDDGSVDTLTRASAEHEDTRTASRLHLNDIGESVALDVFVDLVSGEIETANKKTTRNTFDFEDAAIDVSDDEMTITIDRAEETVVLVIACEGETTDGSGVDLGRFGVDI